MFGIIDKRYSALFNKPAITLAMSAKRTKARWVVYEHRKGKFIRLSRPFTTRAQAEKERDKLEARFTCKKVSFGVGIVKG